jgi:hypothetical protein
MLREAGETDTRVGELLPRLNVTAEAAGAESVAVPVRVVPATGAALGKAMEMTGSGETVTCAELEM